MCTLEFPKMMVKHLCDSLCMWVILACSQLYMYLEECIDSKSLSPQSVTLQPNNRNDRCNIRFTALYFAHNLTVIKAEADSIRHSSINENNTTSPCPPGNTLIL